MATYYLTITPINTLSTSTYSIYYDSITFSNLIASGVPQSTLAAGLLVYFTGSAANATSVYVKNEDPDCCCAVQSYIFPTPSPTTAAPTASPTTAAPTTAAPTTAAPTTAAPTTAAPTTAAPTTAAPTTPTPTSGGGSYSYYSITRFTCPSCTSPLSGLVGRTTNPTTLVTGNYYNPFGDGYVYRIDGYDAGPTFTVDLDGSASAGTNCSGTCAI